MNTTHRCMNCATGRMSLDTRDVTIRTGDRHQVVKGVRGWFCDSCNEIEFEDSDSAERYGAASDALLAMSMSE